ncbi:MAG: hypothetical protein ABIH99_01250 [Candidatus Micrarchaeota archaeon]
METKTNADARSRVQPAQSARRSLLEAKLARESVPKNPLFRAQMREVAKDSLCSEALYSAQKAYEFFILWKTVSFSAFSKMLESGKIKRAPFKGKLVYMGKPFEDANSYTCAEAARAAGIKDIDIVRRHVKSAGTTLTRNKPLRLSGKLLNEICVPLSEPPVRTERQLERIGSCLNLSSTDYVYGSELLRAISELEKELPPAEIEKRGTVPLSKIPECTTLTQTTLRKRVRTIEGKKFLLLFELAKNEIGIKFPLFKFSDGRSPLHLSSEDYSKIAKAFEEEKKKAEEIAACFGELITKGQARRLLNVQKRTIHGYCENGKLKTVSIYGKQLIVKSSAEKLLAREDADAPKNAVPLFRLRTKRIMNPGVRPKRCIDGKCFIIIKELAVAQEQTPEPVRIYTNAIGKRFISREDYERIKRAVEHARRRAKELEGKGFRLLSREDAKKLFGLGDSRGLQPVFNSLGISTEFIGGSIIVLLPKGINKNTLDEIRKKDNTLKNSLKKWKPIETRLHSHLSAQAIRNLSATYVFLGKMKDGSALQDAFYCFFKSALRCEARITRELKIDTEYNPWKPISPPHPTDPFSVLARNVCVLISETPKSKLVSVLRNLQDCADNAELTALLEYIVDEIKTFRIGMN